MISDLRFRISECRKKLLRSNCAPAIRNPQSAIRDRSAITLMEVLISMFVLLFGLMGVAAIFPVGNHYVVEGEKFDQGSILAQNAFEEIQARGMLRPGVWLYADHLNVNTPGDRVIDSTTGAFFLAPPAGPGNAFVIDPMASAQTTVPPRERVYFPWRQLPPDPNNPWPNLLFPPSPGLALDKWPVRRVTLPIPNSAALSGVGPMTTPVAETIFRLRDDLAVSLPERDDAPGIQRWNVGPGNTLLTRQYTGNFSWLATVVPQTSEALRNMQPALGQNDMQQYEVSVVVFYKRDTTPSVTSERLLRAELTGQGEVVLYGNTAQEVDDGLKDMKAGDWICLMGVNQATGNFMMKWYRLLALDEASDTEANHAYDVKSETDTFVMRRAMLIGPDWPTSSYTNLRAAILPGVASVVTRQMTLEKDSLWSGN